MAKIKWGLRKKASIFMIVLILIPAVFMMAVTHSMIRSVEDTVSADTEDILSQQMMDYTVALNRNASQCMETYLDSVKVSVKSAAADTPYHMDRPYAGSSLVWTSRELLTQVNHSLIQDIMDGSADNEYYDEMLRVSGDETLVNSALYYLVHTPELNYSDPHINGSAYAAINALGSLLFERGSRSLYDFLYSVLMPEYREELDSILPIGDMLYSFRTGHDVLWSYYADDDSGFAVLIPGNTYLSPLFNAQVRPWYTTARRDGGGDPVWSSTYMDELTGAPVSTCSVSVFSGGSFQGVVGFDILLSTLSEKTESFYISDTSFAILISGDGIALSCPNGTMLGEDLTQGDTPFSRAIDSILLNESGYISSEIDGREVILVYSTLSCTGWKFINVVDVEEMGEKASDLSHSVGSDVRSAMIYLGLVQLSIGLIAFILAFLIIDTYTRRMERMTRYANEISMGNLDILDIEPETEDEMGELQRSFRRMANSLRVALRELERGDR